MSVQGVLGDAIIAAVGLSFSEVLGSDLSATSDIKAVCRKRAIEAWDSATRERLPGLAISQQKPVESLWKKAFS